MTIEKLNLDISPGKQLFNSASDFYSWYMSWIHVPSSQANVFRILSELMRIALLSAEGGKYLSFPDEDTGIKNLSRLKENLCDGNLKKEATFQELKSLVSNLTAQNPKAKLVSCATELEYQFCILPPPSTHSEYLQNYLNKLLKCVTPSLLEIQAYAISQIMGKILENPPLHKEAGYTLEKEVEQWIRRL
ncbi:MAG: hypothetical protein V4489_01540 [Chlamydiota bacterium]